MGYNCVQLMAVAEHAHYGCFGYHAPGLQGISKASADCSSEQVSLLLPVAAVSRFKLVLSCFQNLHHLRLSLPECSVVNVWHYVSS